MKRKMAPCTAPNCTDEPDAKKIKVEDDSKEKEAIKKQMKKIFYYRDLLERNLKKGKHKEALRTLVDSLVQMTCSDFTNF